MLVCKPELNSLCFERACVFGKSAGRGADLETWREVRVCMMCRVC